MSRALHLLLAIAVFCCGLHVAEPAQAHAEAAHHQLERSADHEHHGTDKRAAEAAHAMHHHCPVAPDPNAAPAPLMMAIGSGVLLTPATPAGLASLTQAPPLEPPAA